MVCMMSIFSQPVLAEQAREAQEPDNRTLLTIPCEDREDLLRVMRNNLTSLGEMIDAMAADDLKTVEKIAHNKNTPMLAPTKSKLRRSD